MKRRTFITLIGGAAASPLLALAQGERVRRVGVLLGWTESDPQFPIVVRRIHPGTRAIGSG